MKKVLIVLLILAAAGLVFYFLFGRTTSEPASQSGATPPPPVSTESAEQTILIQNFSFVPSPVTIKAGTIVTWKNEDNAPHSIVSDPDGEEFESAVFANGEKYFFKFQKVGNFTYHCSIHPYMKGEIIVEQ